MESPQETLRRALECIDAVGVEEEQHACSTCCGYKSEIKKLKVELEEKNRLCNQLQAALQKLMTKPNGVTAVPTMPRGVTTYDLSAEHFNTILALFKKNQVWFNVKPKLIDATIIKLQKRFTDSVTLAEVSSGLTYEECIELVDTEVRTPWEQTLPQGIATVLAGGDVMVYQSHSELSSRSGGSICEPAHYLVYIVRRLHNFISNFMHTWKHGATKKIPDTKHESYDEDETKDTRKRWQDNPLSTEEYSPIIQASRTACACIESKEECDKAVASSVNKLASKPNLAEALRHVSSIVALQEHAAKQGWEIPRKTVNNMYTFNSKILCILSDPTCTHRHTLSHKVLEVWMKLQYTKTWKEYRSDICKALNSLLLVLAIHDKKAVDDILKVMSTSVKAATRPMLTDAKNQLAVNNIEPLFIALNETAKSTESELIYVKMYITLLHSFSDVAADENEEETILLNLLRDLSISPSASLMSAMENNSLTKVVSIISSTILPGMVEVGGTIVSQSLRMRYVKAAIFIGERISYLLRVRELNEQEENEFWSTGMQSLTTFCGLEALQRHANTLPRVLLPKLYVRSLLVDNLETISTMNFVEEATPAGRTGGIGANPMNESTLQLLKPKVLKDMLREMNLADYGAKPDLIARLLAPRHANKRSSRARNSGLGKRKKTFDELEEADDSD